MIRVPLSVLRSQLPSILRLTPQATTPAILFGLNFTPRPLSSRLPGCWEAVHYIACAYFDVHYTLGAYGPNGGTDTCCSVQGDLAAMWADPIFQIF